MNAVERVKDRIESFLFIIISAGVLATVTFVGLGYVIVEMTHRVTPSCFVALAVFLVFAIAEGLTLQAILKGFNDGWHPLAPTFAMRQRRWSLPFRPLIALFWLVHWAAAIALLFTVEHYFPLRDPEWQLRALKVAIFLALTFGINYAGHLYLMVGVSSIWPNEKIVERLWRWRFAIDIGMILLAMLV